LEAAIGCRLQAQDLIRCPWAFPLFLRGCKSAATPRSVVRGMAEFRWVVEGRSQRAMDADRIMSCMEQVHQGSRSTAQNRPMTAQAVAAARPTHRLRRLPRKSQAPQPAA